MGFQVDTLDIYQQSREKSIEVLLQSSEDFFFEWNIGVNLYDQWETSNDDNQNEFFAARRSETYIHNGDPLRNGAARPERPQ